MSQIAAGVTGPDEAGGTGGRDDVVVSRVGAALTLTLSRPEARNALTFAMYEAVRSACDLVDDDDTLRLLVLRGADGAFAAGTDISEFSGFDGDDGLAYEARVDDVVGRLLDVRVPVIAAVDGACVGGGLLLAAAADLRIAHPRATFGLPIARTLGNTVSSSSYRLLLRRLGESRTLDLVLRARLVDAETAAAWGFLTEVTDDVDAGLASLVAQVLAHAPLTLWAAKETMRRLAAAEVSVDVDDILRHVYGSHDFAEGVEAFQDHRGPRWQGR